MSISFSSSKLLSWFWELVKLVEIKSVYEKDNVELLPDFIVFENANLNEIDNNEVNNFLTSLGYELFDYDISTLAIKN